MFKYFFLILSISLSINTYAHVHNYEAKDSTITNIKSKEKGSFFSKIFKSFDNYDHRYISPNYYNFTAMGQNTNTYDEITISASSDDGRSQSFTIAPEPAFKIGPYIGWRWLFIGYTFDVANKHQTSDNTEFKFRLYSSQIGGDIIYKKISGLSHFTDIEGFNPITFSDIKDYEFSAIKSKMLSINAYYIFNHKHFSYPAAFNQSTIQRISCGSWKLGIQYAHQNIKLNPDALPTTLTYSNGQKMLLKEMYFNEINYYDYSISFGYAYNWVFAHNWLLAGSITPALGLKHSKGENLITNEFLKLSNFDFDVITRLGLVWNNTKYFGGISFINHTYNYRKKNFSITNSYSYLNFYIGFFFNKKHQYKNLKNLK